MCFTINKTSDLGVIKHIRL